MPPLSGRRITIVSRLFAPEPAAASFRLNALAHALHEAGAETRVVTTRPPAGYPVDPAADAGVDVRRARVLRDREGYVRGYLQYLSFDVPAFFRVLTARRPDLVVVEPPPTTGVVMRVVCALRRIPYVYYAADIWGDAVLATTAPRVVARVVSAMERWALRGARTVICVSDEFAERLRELGITSPVVTIGNGVDIEKFSPEGAARSLPEPYFLYAGTASEVHGATIFVEALRRVRDGGDNVRLAFVGQGADRDAIEKLAAAFPDGVVTFESRRAPGEAAEWIRGAAATLASVHPGAYPRAFPTKMYASIACGTRVIYAGIGPGRDFAAQDGFGWSVDYDADQIADAMRAAIRAPELEAERTRRARWAADNISLRAVAARAVEQITRTLAA